MKQSCYFAKVVCDLEFNKKHIRVLISKPVIMAYQKFAFENCSMYNASSVKGATWRSPWVGNILPETKNTEFSKTCL